MSASLCPFYLGHYFLLDFFLVSGFFIVSSKKFANTDLPKFINTPTSIWEILNNQPVLNSSSASKDNITISNMPILALDTGNEDYFLKPSKSLTYIILQLLSGFNIAFSSWLLLPAPFGIRYSNKDITH